MNLHGLASINVELTSRCDKSCWMCGRRKIERDHPEKANWGDMPIGMVADIASQTPPGITVQLHNNGEPLLYPDLKKAIDLFHKQITGLDTNAKLLLERAQDIWQLDTLTISIIQDDDEGVEQFEIVKKYLDMYPFMNRPLVVFRLLGMVENGHAWRKLAQENDCLIAERTLHDPMGSRKYETPRTVPEMGICLEVLHKLSIDRYGNVSPCVRFDPEGYGVLGDMRDGLEILWNGAHRQKLIRDHSMALRSINPLCKECEYWGLPS